MPALKLRLSVKPVASSTTTAMTSLMTPSRGLFLCWMIMAQCRAEDLPVSYMDFLNFFNGHFDNFDQDNEEGGNHDRIESIMKPVIVQGLQKDPVFYSEEAINGKVYRMVVAVRNERSNDLILYITFYNISDPSQYKPGTFNTDDLANLTREVFRGQEGCEAAFKMVSPGTLMGEVMDCRHSLNGQHPTYTMTATCSNVYVISPLSADETYSRSPYNLKHKGPRYPLTGAPKDYVSPCPDGR